MTSKRSSVSRSPETRKPRRFLTVAASVEEAEAIRQAAAITGLSRSAWMLAQVVPEAERVIEAYRGRAA